MKKSIVVLAFLIAAQTVLADVTLTDKGLARQLLTRNSDLQHTLGKISSATPMSAGEKALIRAENRASHDAKMSSRQQHSGRQVSILAHPRKATGSVQLIDASGLKYFINTNITFSSSGASQSGAASEASYTTSVAATTSGGGVSSSTLNDMFDGYGAICLNFAGGTGPCANGNPAYPRYNHNGPATVDATVPATSFCTGRQYVFNAQVIGGVSVQRKVYVPTNDTYIRWADILTNTTAAPLTFNLITNNNVGSDSNTVIVTSSNGDAVAQPTDLWISSFQAYSGNTSSDVRIGHILQGAGAPTPVSFIHFVNGDDVPYWDYPLTLAAGQTKIILTYATGQPSKAAAAAKAAQLAAFGANAQQCLSATELSRVVNFASGADLSIVKTGSGPTAFGGVPYSYNIAVSNAGPGAATSVSVSDTLPAGSTFVSATGTGWTCNNVAGVVTCTLPTLAVGPATPITLTINPPAVASPGTLSNTASVSSASTDPVPGNNSSTTTAVPLLPGQNVPALSAFMLVMLGLALGLVALSRR